MTLNKKLDDAIARWYGAYPTEVGSRPDFYIHSLAKILNQLLITKSQHHFQDDYRITIF